MVKATNIISETTPTSELSAISSISNHLLDALYAFSCQPRADGVVVEWIEGLIASIHEYSATADAILLKRTDDPTLLAPLLARKFEGNLEREDAEIILTVIRGAVRRDNRALLAA
jgi:hypothetical protein